jgi:hypothetical protein
VALLASFPVQGGNKTQPTPARHSEASPVFPKVEGWTLSDGPTRYTPETLFEYIDGGADAFLQFDFEELASATYVAATGSLAGKQGAPPMAEHAKPRSKVEVTLDIYRHKDAVRAFGMYSQERPAGSTLLSIGADGYAGPDYLAFVVGAYYVKAVLSGSEDPAILRLFASKLASILPGTSKVPAVLQCFPDHGKRVRAEKLAAHNFLGHAFLHDAIAVPYDLAGASFRLFVVEGQDSTDVRTMVQSYRALEKSKNPGTGEGAFEGSAMVRDPLNGAVDLHWKGRWLWGAVDEPRVGSEALVEALGRNLPAAK